jgi:hypothetical protein
MKNKESFWKRNLIVLDKRNREAFLFGPEESYSNRCITRIIAIGMEGRPLGSPLDVMSSIIGKQR